MNFDDSQLSAFLDDELDPGDRQLVAWNLETSSVMAQQLADFRSIQGEIAGLDRPAIPVDLTAAVLTKMRRPEPSSLRPLVRAGRAAAMLVGVGSLAASLMIALILLYRPLHDDNAPALFTAFTGTAPARHDLPHPHPAAAAPALASAPAPSPASTDRSASASRARSAAPSARAVPTQVAELRAQFAPPGPVAGGVDGPEEARPGQVDAMLGHRRVLRALIVTDFLQHSSRQVQGLIEQDGVREAIFGQITLADGIVVDPDQPGQAEVFSVVMNSSRTRPFLEQLAGAFPGVRIEAEAAPALITHLSEVGQVAVFSGVRPAPLGSPPNGISVLVAAKDSHPVDHFPAPVLDTHRGDVSFPGDSLAEGRTDRDLTKPLTGPTATIRAEARSAPEREAADRKADLQLAIADEPVTVLVWVARRR